MSKVAIENGQMIYRKMFKEIRIPLEDILWGYHQIEDVRTMACCANMILEVHRVIFTDRSGKQHVFEYEEKERAEALLAEMAEKNPAMAVGYTEVNKERFLTAQV